MKKKNIKRPEKTIVIKNSRTYYEWQFSYVNHKEVPLQTFLKWCKKTLSKNAENVIIKVIEEWCYDDNIINLELYWTETKLNPKYDKQLEKYLKSIEK